MRSEMRKKAMRDVSKVRRRRITIRKLVEGQDKWGNPSTEKVDWLPLWVKRSTLWGQEYYAAKRVDEEQTIVFELPYCKKLEELNTIEFDILFEGEEFDIKHIDPLEDGGNFIKVRCLKRGLGHAKS